jgi:hypothetical protein
MRQISKGEFERRVIIREWKSPWLCEVRWFEEGSVLGAVLLDMLAGDWNALAFVHDRDGCYRVADMALSYKTVDEACGALGAMMEEKSLDGAFSAGREEVFA